MNEASLSDYRYLDLLARVKRALDSAREVLVPAEEIRPFSDQPRKYFNEESVRRLSESIDSGGQTTSGMIRERPGLTRYELIDGERRWRAVLLIPPARRPAYKAKQIDADDDVVQYLISGIANFNREGHTALEVMETISRLSEFGLPTEEIASLLGIGTNWAYDMLSLRKLIPAVRAMLDPNLPKAQRLPVVAAVQISKIDGRYQMNLAQRVLRKDITLSRLRGEVIKTAQATGAHVRQRTLDPSDLWRTFDRRTLVLARSITDILDVLNKAGFGSAVRAQGRAPDVDNCLKRLEQIVVQVKSAEAKLRKLRSK